MGLTGKKIIVVGAGIGGLAAALSLRQKGADVIVLEQAGAITEVGAGLQISPNGAVVLSALGLEDELSRNAVKARAVVLRDYRRAGEVLRLDLERHAPGQDYFLVHRADLIDVLAQAVRRAGVQVRLLQRVDRVDASDRPVLHMGNGARLRADGVVGADGLHSVARVALNGGDKPFFTGQTAWRAVVPNSLNLPDQAQLFMGPGRHVVCYPLRGGQAVNLVAVQEQTAWTAEGWHHQDDPDRLRHAFSDFSGMAGELLQQVTQVSRWGLFRHPVARHWHKSSVALLGDAAHPTLPFLAQGANMALEDAWVLADTLDSAARIDSGLASYQARRRDRVARVVAAASRNAWKYHLRFPPLRSAAHLALRLGGHIAPGRMVRQFDWIYGHDVTRGG